MASQQAPQRDSWAGRIGIIMAVAGSAVGLGNFLVFPSKVAQFGGGAFLIPYFIAIVLLGIPLMWVEWTIGRYGGGFGHGTAPGVFHHMGKKNRFIKYFGVVGIFGPIAILMFYTFLESWLLGYTYYAVEGSLMNLDQGQLAGFLSGYIGVEKNDYFDGIAVAYLFFVATFLVNMIVVYRGIRGGIELVCRVAMPLLLVLGIVLAVRVLTLPSHEASVSEGLGFLWNPKWDTLKDPNVWLQGTAQVFFTLSVGIGVILTYASYLKRGDDVALSGLTAVSTNEFAEVILGGTIVIPATVVFFGAEQAGTLAESVGGLAFITVPMIFQQLPAGQLFAILWFGLLFLAGVTSTVSLAQPAIAFLEDEFNITRQRATLIFGVVCFVLCQPVIFFNKYGVMDDVFLWGGYVSLVVFALLEAIMFGWVLGIDKAWSEVHHGAELRIPVVFKYIIKYVSPLYIIVVLVWFLKEEWMDQILMRGVDETSRGYLIAGRILLAGLFVALILLVALAWRGRDDGSESQTSASSQEVQP